ncbi:MAG TPA: BrnT family toxin [Rhodanobacteraceae bacterium]|nr:BrnT family toxin [Rhodanobacteraceae bacterium]
MRFEWDAAKAGYNLAKHGVAFEEALTCFFDSKQIAFYDPDHSEDEDRELLIGHSSQGRLLIVCYTLRGRIARLISARKPTRREARAYAQGI